MNDFKWYSMNDDDGGFDSEDEMLSRKIGDLYATTHNGDHEIKEISDFEISDDLLPEIYTYGDELYQEIIKISYEYVKKTKSYLLRKGKEPIVIYNENKLDDFQVKIDYNNRSILGYPWIDKDEVKRILSKENILKSIRKKQCDDIQRIEATYSKNKFHLWRSDFCGESFLKNDIGMDMMFYGFGSKMFLLTHFFLSLFYYCRNFEELDQSKVKFLIITSWDKSVTIEGILNFIIKNIIKSEDKILERKIKNSAVRLSQKLKIIQNFYTQKQQNGDEGPKLIILLHNIDILSKKSREIHFKLLTNDLFNNSALNEQMETLKLNIKWLLTVDDDLFPNCNFRGKIEIIDTLREPIMERTDILLKKNRYDDKFREFIELFETQSKSMKEMICVVLHVAYNKRRSKNIKMQFIEDFYKKKIDTHLDDMKDLETLFVINKEKKTISIKFELREVRILVFLYEIRKFYQKMKMYPQPKNVREYNFMNGDCFLAVDKPKLKIRKYERPKSIYKNRRIKK